MREVEVGVIPLLEHYLRQIRMVNVEEDVNFALSVRIGGVTPFTLHPHSGINTGTKTVSHVDARF